jgi:DHA1 family multidrug resistance protein-like MFS transporter
MVEAIAPHKNPPVYLQKPILKLLLIAFLAELGYAVMNISTMPVYLKDDRNFGESTIGLVFVAFLFSEAAFKSPMGHLADKFGPKRLMMFGPAISVITALLSLLVPKHDASTIEVLTFIGLRACDGLGAAMLWPAAFAAVNEVVSDEDRQQAMSLLNLCYLLGIAIAFEFGGIANDLTHTKFAGLVLAALCFLGVSLAVFYLMPDVRPKEHKAGELEASMADFLKSLKQVPQYLILAVITFAGIGFPMAIFKIFPTDQFGFTETQIGSLICPGAIIMGIASIPMGKFADKIGRIRAVHLGLLLCAIGMGVIGSGAFVKVLRTPLVFCLGGLPVGIGFLLAIPAWMASVSDIDPEKRGANLGAVMTAQGIGAIIGAPIGAAMYEKLQPVGIHLHLGESFGRYSPFLGCAVCAAFGWAISLRILRPGMAGEKPTDEEHSTSIPEQLAGLTVETAQPVVVDTSETYS